MCLVISLWLEGMCCVVLTPSRHFLRQWRKRFKGHQAEKRQLLLLKLILKKILPVLKNIKVHNSMYIGTLLSVGFSDDERG